MSDSEADRAHMRAALTLAARGLGNTWPNPSVGCVVVKDGRVVGRALTAASGRPHAEPQAIAMAGDAARGATMYVTLEPCCFHGRTPPCTDAILAAGIARVVVAMPDPDPRVDGKGLARLRDGGVHVTTGLLADEAMEVNAGLTCRICAGRPMVTLKLASTLDGRIATSRGESQWITGEDARRAAHGLRGRHDAVLVGAGTVLADDPDLTCRIPGYTRLPTMRVIADSRLRTPLTARVVSTAAAAPTLILVAPGHDPARAEAMRAAGVELVEVPRSEAGLDLRAGLAALAERGLTRILAEGGAQLAATLLRADLVDRVAWFHAPAILGGDAWPAAEPFGAAALAEMPRFVRVGLRAVGADMLSEYVRAA